MRRHCHATASMKFLGLPCRNFGISSTHHVILMLMVVITSVAQSVILASQEADIG